MQFSWLAPVLLVVFASQLFSGCSPKSGNTNSSNSSAAASTNSQTGPDDNIDEFMLLVRLPVQPEEVAWRDYPNQKKLVAVVRFSSENAAKMSAEVAKGAQPTSETLSVESWYPAELIAQSDVTGESTVKAQSYPAEPFLNPPYTKGKISRVENTDYFILQISS